MHHRCRLLILGIAFLQLMCARTIAQSQERSNSQKRPNVIFILADDLGWGDLGCYGNPRAKTPNLDRLASRGTLFTQFYVNGSVCSPSRCAFFTGQYPGRHKIHGHYSTPEQNKNRGMSQFLDPAVPNLARTLHDHGYKTGHIGKWHLGSNSGGPEPDAYGFDYVGAGEKDGANGPASDPYYRAKSTEMFVNQALEFIKTSHDEGKPFYLQLWTLVPHATLNPTPEQMKPYQNFRAGGPKFPHASAAEIFYASVTDLDTQIGRLIQGLEQAKVLDNTLIFFSSDNGPEDIHISNAGHSGVGSAGPFRGRKRSLYEGGVRVPAIAHWPGHVPEGVINEDAVLAAVDWLPTVCHVTGTDLPKDHALDGQDATDLFNGRAWTRSRPLFWQWRFRIAGEPFHHSPELAMRDGPWKLYMNPDESRVELYQMQEDLMQMNNLADKHPEIVQRMKPQLLEWAKDLPEGPRDPGAGKVTVPMPRLKR